MKKVLLIGDDAVGKLWLLQQLCKEPVESRRAMAVEHHGFCVNTPTEFLENRRFYRALISASQECHTILIVQRAKAKSCLFPPQFVSMFNRCVLGICLYEREDENTDLAKRFLHQAGARNILQICMTSGKGMDLLWAQLEA